VGAGQLHFVNPYAGLHSKGRACIFSSIDRYKDIHTYMILKEERVVVVIDGL
jgi:hypothetical protein